MVHLNHMPIVIDDTIYIIIFAEYSPLSCPPVGAASSCVPCRWTSAGNLSANQSCRTVPVWQQLWFGSVSPNPPPTTGICLRPGETNLRLLQRGCRSRSEEWEKILENPCELLNENTTQIQSLSHCSFDLSCDRDLGMCSKLSNSAQCQSLSPSFIMIKNESSLLKTLSGIYQVKNTLGKSS